jgi:hypothetical protein
MEDAAAEGPEVLQSAVGVGTLDSGDTPAVVPAASDGRAAVDGSVRTFTRSVVDPMRCTTTIDDPSNPRGVPSGTALPRSQSTTLCPCPTGSAPIMDTPYVSELSSTRRTMENGRRGNPSSLPELGPSNQPRA